MTVPETSVDALLDHIETVFKEYPELKAKMLDEVGEELLSEVQSQMAISGLHAGGGRLRQWQKYHVGSRKGYVAVRPIGSKEGATTGPNSPGAITNYVDGGHAVRRRTANAKRSRKSRATVAAVPGRHFYAATNRMAEAYGSRRARELAVEFVRRLEGAG